MKAKISQIQLDIDYRCPNCYLHFRLSNNDIPQKKPKKLECPECAQQVSLPTIQITRGVEKPPKAEKESPLAKKAALALRSQGYNLGEAKTLISSIYDKNMSLADLIKAAISNDEPKTRKI